MKTIKEIRLDNARLLQAEAGSQKLMIEISGKSQSQISQIMGDKAKKGIGNKVARELEVAFNKPPGWLDTPHTLELSPEISARDFVRGLAESMTEEQRDEMLIELANRAAHKE